MSKRGLFFFSDKPVGQSTIFTHKAPSAPVKKRKPNQRDPRGSNKTFSFSKESVLTVGTGQLFSFDGDSCLRGTVPSFTKLVFLLKIN